MTVTLQNSFLKATFSEVGAELQSLVDQNTGIEYMWQADPKIWGRHAPVLFPIVGKLKDDTYRYQGQEYHLPQHGFARNQIFTANEVSDTQVIFHLEATQETRAVYPFEFILEVIYTLDNNLLTVSYRVENPSADSELLFSVGGHPGFRVPLTKDEQFTDYYLSFEPRKSRVRVPLVGPYSDLKHRTLATTDVDITLNHELFKNDALIYETVGKNTFALKSDQSVHHVALTVQDASYVGVWSAYPAEGAYVCLEPWWGIADSLETTGELAEKAGINHLAPGETFQHGFKIATF